MKIRKWTLAALIVAAGAIVMVFSWGDDSFEGLLEYEAQNRAFSRISLPKAVDASENEAQRKFWKSYVALEELNQRTYSPMLKKYGVEEAPSTLTNLKAWSGGLVMPLVPSVSTRLVRDAAIDYVPKLERLRSLATDDKEFFSYVVAQEQIQADALVLAADGDFAGGADLIDKFIDQHAAVQD